MLFVHDVYAVIGEREFEFEDAVRDGYASAVADDDTRFLRYLHSVHGSGEAYLAVMLTAVRDGDALERLVERIRYGDLSEWYMRATSMRYWASSTLLVAADWSPAAQIDLGAVPVGDIEHDGAIFREDVLEGTGVHDALAASAAARGDDDGILGVEAAFRSALDPDNTVRVLYRIADPQRWTPVLAADTGWNDLPGSLTATVPDGVTGSARYLRSSRWSPMG